MNKIKPTIAIDMDGVLADVEPHLIEWYARDYGVRIKREDMLGKAEADSFPDQLAVRKIIFTPGFFRTLPVMSGAVEAVKGLMEDFDVYIVSAAMEFPQSLPEKLEWLAEHFPFISWKKIVFCGDKSIIDTNYLIDDHCKNLDFCKGKAILFNAAHNFHIDRHQRVNDWEEVKTLFHNELNTSNIR